MPARIVALLVVIAISVYIVFLPEEQVQQLEALGYPGAFLISMITNATVLVPAPGFVVIGVLGARFSPFWVGVWAGAGAAIGELSGYLAGFSGQAVIDDFAVYNRMVAWMDKYGWLAIVGLAAIPNPAFDITGIAAGALKMPIWEFLFWVFIGKTIKFLLIAFAGAGILSLPGLGS